MNHHFELEPEEIDIGVRVRFDIRLEHDEGRGGYLVQCQKLPEVMPHGATLNLARADAKRKIIETLGRRAEAGKGGPQLTYAPLPNWRRWKTLKPAIEPLAKRPKWLPAASFGRKRCTLPLRGCRRS